MQKNRLIFFGKFLQGRRFPRPHQNNSQILSFCTILIAVFQLFAINVQAQSVEQDIRELKPGETIERQAKANDTHAYEIALEAGTVVEITFGKREMPLQFRVFAPKDEENTASDKKTSDGKEMYRYFLGDSKFLAESLFIVAEKTGKHIVKLSLNQTGNYSITCSPSRAASERDRKYAAALKLFSEAGETIGKRRSKLEERVAIYRSLDDKKSLAVQLRVLGQFFVSNGELEKAIKYYREALDLCRSLNSVADVLAILNLIGSASAYQMGDYQSAIDSYSEYLSISRSSADKNHEAGALHQLGVVYHLLADEQKARDFYEQSLQIRSSTDPPTIESLSGMGVTLTNIGNLYRGVGGGDKPIVYFSPRTKDDLLKALEYYRQSIEIARRVTKLNPNASTLETFNLHQIGNIYKEFGNYSEALTYLNQSLERARASKWVNGEANVLKSIGNLYVRKGENQKSFEYFDQSIAILNSGVVDTDKAEYLISIAKDYYRMGETKKALDLYNEALAHARTREQQDISAMVLFEIAGIERDLGNFNNARSRIEESLQIVELLRAKMTAEALRLSYFSAAKKYYDFYVDLLMQAHKSQPEKKYDELALRTSEQSRSRSLLDLLIQSKVDIKQGVDPTLLEREKAVRERLGEKANQQTRLLLAKHTKEEAEKIKAEVSNLTDQYQSVRAEVKNKSPRYAALTQPTSLNAKQIQELLDSGTILLEYSLGEKKSYLWAVTNDSITSFDLPGREEIEAQARRVYELLTARNENPKNETDAQRRSRLKSADEEYSKAAANLSRMLLAPAASLMGSKRLLIVADGALNYIPFSALPPPKNVETANQQQPLGINHEVVTLPSASILALLREETPNRKPAPKMLAVFADPVFSQADIRADSVAAARTSERRKQNNTVSVSKNGIEKSSFSRDFERAVIGVGLRSSESGGLPRLPFSRREADSIFKVAPKNLSLKEVDFNASKTAVFNSNLDQYKILHFATHGLLNSQHPELSGIVLSLIDKKGGEVDGFLRLQDIYNLKLAADLVVLSACNTALGKDVKGEGLIGLTRGFMYAGTPRVVASLWKVDDAATAEFMSIFYKKMLTENLRPAAALRAAQAEMVKQNLYKSPYYWAPFIIQGEWK
jgi:CHAT domain-containing protein